MKLNFGETVFFFVVFFLMFPVISHAAIAMVVVFDDFMVLNC